jgi:hypothetical protein
VPDELLSGDLPEVFRHTLDERLRHEGSHGAQRKLVAGHRRRLDDGSLVTRQQVEPRRQQRMDGGWHLQLAEIRGGLPAVVGTAQPA